MHVSERYLRLYAVGEPAHGCQANILFFVLIRDRNLRAALHKHARIVMCEHLHRNAQSLIQCAHVLLGMCHGRAKSADVDTHVHMRHLGSKCSPAMHTPLSDPQI